MPALLEEGLVSTGEVTMLSSKKGGQKVSDFYNEYGSGYYALTLGLGGHYKDVHNMWVEIALFCHLNLL